MPHNALRSLPKIESLLYQYASEGVYHAGSRHADALRALAEALSAAELPVFKRMVDLLTNLSDNASPSALLDAAALSSLSGSALSGSVQATQTAPITPARARSPRRAASYRALQRAKEALAGRGADRVETLQRYGETGADFRLAPLLAEALCDPEPDVRLLCRQWLTELGPAAASLMASGLDVRRANALDARKAALTACLLGEDGFRFSLDCYQRGGKAVRAAVLDALTRFGGEEGFQLTVNALYDPEPTTREAAFRALSRFGGETAVAPLEQAAVHDFRAATFALSALRHASAGQALLRLGESATRGDARRLSNLADALGRREEKTSQGFDYLCVQLFRLQEGAFSEESRLSAEIALTQALASWNTPDALDVLERFLPRAQMPVIILEAALRLRSPEDFYERYGQPLGETQYRAVRGLLYNLLTRGQAVRLDMRWNDRFRRENDGMMAALTAEPGMDGAECFLRRFEMCRDLTSAENLHLLFCVYPQTLLRIGADGFWPDLLEALESMLCEFPPESGFPWRHLQDRTFAETFALGGPDTAKALLRLAETYPHDALKELSSICEQVCEGWIAWKS